MSEIPFVTALGDAIERSAAAHIAGRRRRIRRRLTIGVLGFAVAATGVAAASGVFSSPEQLASTGVACFDRAALNRNVTVISAGDLTPIEACRRVLDTDAPLVACVDQGVHVFPGGPGTCERLGMEPLPAEYAAARAKVVELGHAVGAVEAAADCIAPGELAQRLQRVLDRLGWTGWRTQVRDDLGRGPCGWALAVGGDGSVHIEGALLADEHRLIVTPGPAHSTWDVLTGLLAREDELRAASTDRCHTRAELEALARKALARVRRTVTFAADRSTGSYGAEMDERLAEGCAVIVSLGPAADGYGIAVSIRG